MGELRNMEASCQLHDLAAVPGETASGTHCIGSWVGLKACQTIWRTYCSTVDSLSGKDTEINKHASTVAE